jgi:hypothetical protein
VQVKAERLGRTESVRMMTANALVLVDHQLLYLYSYANDQLPDARGEAERSVSAWADAIRAANPDDPAVARQAKPFVADGGLLYSPLVPYLFFGLMAGLVVFAVGWVTKRRR